MALKFVVFAAFVASASASVIAAPLAEPYHNPQYSYGYEVHDPFTGDSHGQEETRSGDVVRGSYALLDSDGTRRVVNYAADPVNGFNAVVSKQPVASTVITAPAAISSISAARVSVPGVAPVVPLVRTAPVVAGFSLGAPTLVGAPAFARIGAGPYLASAPWTGSSVVGASSFAAGPWQGAVRTV